MKSTSQIYKLYLTEVTKSHESRMIATYLHWFSPKIFLRKYSIKFLKSYMHLEDTNLHTGLYKVEVELNRFSLWNSIPTWRNI